MPGPRVQYTVLVVAGTGALSRAKIAHMWRLSAMQCHNRIIRPPGMLSHTQAAFPLSRVVLTETRRGSPIVFTTAIFTSALVLNQYTFFTLDFAA